MLLNRASVILFFVTSFILYNTKGAFAALMWKKIVQTSEGPVTKILFDGSNPANYPIQAFAIAFIGIVIANVIIHRKVFDKFRTESDPTEITLKDLTSGKLPLNTKEPDRAFVKTIEKIRETDENFSIPVFLKYVEFIFLKTFLHRIDAEWNGAAYFFMIHVIHHLQRRFKGIKLVKNMAIVSCKLLDLECYNAGTNKVVVEVTSTYEALRHVQDERFLLTEKWVFTRFKGIKSPLPDTQFEFYCPVCQNESSPNMDGLCSSCGKMITSGKYDWVVESIEKVDEIPFDEVEAPWEYNFAQGWKKTVVQGELSVRLDKIEQRNRDLNWDSIKDIALDMTKQFYLKLFSNEFGDLKNILAPCAYNTKSFVRNKVLAKKDGYTIADILISDKKIVRADADPFYDIVTLRLWGTMATKEIGEDGKDIIFKNIFSDYVTIFKKVKGSDKEWRIALIESDEDYLP